MLPDVAPLPHPGGGGGARELHRAKQSPVRRPGSRQRGRAQQVVFPRDQRRVQHFGRVERVDFAGRSQRRHRLFAVTRVCRENPQKSVGGASWDPTSFWMPFCLTHRSETQFTD